MDSDNQIYFIQASVKEMSSMAAYRTDVTTEMDKRSNAWRSLALEVKAQSLKFTF